MRSRIVQPQCVCVADRLVMRGRARIIERCAETGRLTREQVVDNLIVNAGLAFVLDCLKGDTFNRASYFAVGNHVEPPAATDTQLHGEVYRAQVATSRRVGDNQLRITCFIPSGQANGYTLQEFGIFGDPNTDTGPMLCRLIYGAIVKNVSTQITYIWTGTLAAS